MIYGKIPQPISITLYSEKLKGFSPRSGKRKGWPLVTLLLNIVLELLDKEIRQGKANKSHPNWKGRNKIICLQITWSYIWKFLKTPHTHTHTHTHSQVVRNNQFSKVRGYKILCSSHDSVGSTIKRAEGEEWISGTLFPGWFPAATGN